ncbi:MAG: ABC transporter substrate-binding protein [Solirubrobacteraceae bacterium]|nr:ABC transporter substrate-binding protein [Solirubrobacteraceae bacterium]
MNVRRPLLLLAALVATLALASCGERDEPGASAPPPPTEELSLLLDYHPNANHVGIYKAEADGRFEDAGLKVRIQQPSDPATVLQQVAAGRVDVAISYQPEIMLARAAGSDVVAFAAVVQRPLTSLISLPHAKIAKPADLKGKTVGTAGIAYQTAYLDTILEQAGVDPKDVKRVNVGSGLNQALIGKKVDATLGAFWNYEGVELTRRDRRPVVVPVDELGVPEYAELVLVARAETLRDRESAVRRFVRAVAVGYDAVKRDPVRGTIPLLRANRDLDAELQEEVVEKTLGAFFPKDDDKPWGWLDFDGWARYGQWMVENGLLKQRIALDQAVTTDFLPGEGAGEGRKTPGGKATPSEALPGYRGS